MKNLIEWLASQLTANKYFEDYIDKKIKSFYKNDSLTLYRVWGDESKVKLANNTQVNNALFNTVSGTITVEEYTFFGHNVSLLTGTHDYSKKNINRQKSVPLEGRDIYIGKGVWLASNVTVLGPCKIGDNSVIAANSLITGEIPANSLYAGSPARFVKDLLFDE